MKHVSARTLAIALAGATATSLLVAPPATAAPDGSLPVISEAYGGGGNNGAAYSHDFVELFNPTDTEVDLSGWAVEYYSASGNLGNTTELTGTIPAGGHFLIQQNPGANTDLPTLPTPDVIGTANMSGSQGSLKLIDATSAEVDLLGWGEAALAEGAAALKTSNPVSVQRTVAGLDTDNNAVDFIVDTPTPEGTNGGAVPETPEVPETPGQARALSIAEIQGAGDATPVAGELVTTEGVVTAVYSEGGFNGYYIQTPGTGAELKSAGDASDGIFIYVGSGAVFPTVGDSVVVTGEAAEHYGLTQLKNITATTPDEDFEAVVPAAIDTMPADPAVREAYEGMLLQPTGAYTVTNNYALNDFGEIGLAAGTAGYLQSTEAVAPGAEANAYEAANQAELITLDDGRSGRYMQGDKDVPLPWIVQDDGQTIKSIRTGDQVDFQNPVIFDYRFDLWRFQPTTPVTGATAGVDLPITWEDSRTAELAAIDNVDGDFHIASFNVLNYFTSLGKDYDCDAYTDISGNPISARGCDVRGAYSEQAFADQQGKIVAAINKLDVDVLGLEEIENTYAVTGDVERRDEALNKLVDALNTAHGSERWAAVESPLELGTDEDVIRVAFIYDMTTVKPVGESRIFDDAAYTGTARQPLAQEFQTLDESKESFVGVVNHFKSKGSPVNGDEDMNDGQGHSANVRLAQAQALIDHLDNQDDWADKPVFILGDLNAYSKETVLSTLAGAGYRNIAEAHDAGLSYQFSGRLGSLDHALGNAQAMDRTVDAEVWDINADEPLAFEYSRRNYNVVDVFEADNVFRSSDHDPIKVGFNLKSTDAPVETPDEDDPAEAPAEPTGSAAGSSTGTTVGILAALVGLLGLAMPWVMELPSMKAIFK
ncbi:ExeM/NucH family extracellular endonuclease [uncultured Corynebacterium sp.]|uniref:ExeM/NucH family extracellular endonuclease n=1 Tax=uncultured Corynebacterium sp. TaxID=159447 RepID=UPI0025D8BFEE|nr:ExeM/NucH family extracellular endonuclease [uncultured Corynebacterium sp.]